ncbi:pyrroloquinoline quinone biosynthesis protein PqqE [Proteobacteria bacterium 005FR1]|nr:pyrroloquinoline quinone biosynthesis protein PqqE [Proteobacteria bacterium 005FR1]
MQDFQPHGSPENKPAESKPIPMWLLAELTYACPLQCPYCSNPLQLPSSRKEELSTQQWLDVMRQARELGAVQLGFSGGEPLVRPDLEQLIREANDMGFFCNLITSAIGLDEEKIRAFKYAGLRHIQISFQGSDAESNAYFGGTDSFDHKLAMAKKVVEHELPLGLNFVLHRHNLHQVKPFLEQALALGAEFVELANSQYYGWALHNRDELLPSKKQLEDAERVTNEFRAQHPGEMDVFFVAPDYYDDRPKKCSNGWGTTFITVNPKGEVLPCQSAHVIPGLEIPNVKESSLKDIWLESDLFHRFRGLDWMREPCRTCPEREIDLGGCRCQAFLLTGDASNADPVCSLSPHHHKITEAVEAAQRSADEVQTLVFRNPRNAKKIAEEKS